MAKGSKKTSLNTNFIEVWAWVVGKRSKIVEDRTRENSTSRDYNRTVLSSDSTLQSKRASKRNLQLQMSGMTIFDNEDDK